MKTLAILGFIALLSAQTAQALQVMPPEQVLRGTIQSSTSNAVPTSVDLTRVTRANPKHNANFVTKLLRSLNTKDLRIQKTKPSDLTVHVLAPRRVSFEFEARQAKRLGGGHYAYYIVVAIHEERIPNKSLHRSTYPRAFSARPSAR